MKKAIAILLVAFSLLCLGGCADLNIEIDFPEFETEPVITHDLSGVPESLFGLTNSLAFSMTDSDGHVSGPYQVSEMPEHFILGTCTLLTEVNLSKYDSWLTISCPEGYASLTVYDGYRDILCVDNGESVTYYQDSDGTTFETLRQDFDTLEYHSREQISFYYYETGTNPLREFASNIYPDFRKGLTKGSPYRFEGYDLLYCEILEQTENTITGEIGYFAIVNEQVLPEGSEPGTGAFEGWFYIHESVKLELQSDGAWHRVEEFGLTAPTEPTETPTETPAE